MKQLLNNIPEILLLLFLIITFLQSAYDKIVDWGGNLAWLKGHFAASPFKNQVPLLLAIVLVFELLSGVSCLIGLVRIVVAGSQEWALYGGVLSCISLLMLLLGQRVAKDYDGARTIAIYFMPAIFLVYLVHMP